MLSAMVGFAGVYIGYFALSPVVSKYYAGLNNAYGSVSMGGLTLGGVLSANFVGFGLFFVAAVVGLGIYLIAGSGADEYDTGEMTLD